MTRKLRGKDARAAAEVAMVPAKALRAHPRNIRQDLGDIRELTESIRAEGVLVPLMVERRDTCLRILHGHRRWAAALEAKVARVPAVVVAPHTDSDAIFVMLAEDKKNPVSREDKQRAVLTLREEFRCTWPEIATRLGISIPTARAWAGLAGGPAADPGPPRLTPVPSTPAPRPPRPIRKPSPPSIGPTKLHQLLADHDAGRADIVVQLREWLGDWRPVAARDAEVAA